MTTTQEATTNPTPGGRSNQGHHILDYSEVDQLLRSGWTQVAVARKYGVTQAAVSQARRRGRLKDGDTKVMHSLPWKVRKEHLNLYAPKMLRTAARLEAGYSIGDSLAPQVAVFLQGLESTDAVIHYEPDLDPPFIRVPRRQGIDLWWVRDPHVNDDGTPND